MTHHLILGAGPAGVIAAETIRKMAPQDRITIVGDEPEPSYSRMAIPYLLIGNVDERGTYLRKSPTHFSDLNIQLVPAKVTAVNAAAKTVSLDDGQNLTFDTLLIATGSHPIRPPIPGIERSINTSFGCKAHASWTASLPLSASPTISMSS